MLKLAIVVPFLNQTEITKQTLKFLVENKTNPDTKILAFDNDSDEEIELPDGVDYYRSEVNIGNYPVFSEALEFVKEYPVIAFFHSDLFVYEKGYDDRILQTFHDNQNLGLAGFVGSDEIDVAGGRGGGTMSNFMGYGTVITRLDGTLKEWKGSPAEAHGKRETGFKNAAVVDGCSMIFRKKALEDIGFNPNFPLHHFYDRYMSCQMLEKQWKVGVLGIAFDHISGQTANQEQRYHDAAKDWCDAHGVQPPVIHQNNYDMSMYLEGERIFLREYRNEKRLIPIKVAQNN